MPASRNAAPSRYVETKTETISIALATCNGEKYLQEQLNSLLEQTMRPAELIVCDDVSTDRTAEIVSDFAKTAPFPVQLVINQQRLGYKANFMKAAALCRSDLIAFCDQDDIWDREKLEIVFKHISESNSNCVLLQHGFRLIDGQGRQISGPIEYVPPESGTPWASGLGLTQVFRKSLMGYLYLWERSVDHHFPNEKMAHDQWISFLANILGDIVTLTEPLLSYRQHDLNVFGFKEIYQHDQTITRSNINIILSRLSRTDNHFLVKRLYLEHYTLRLASSALSRIKLLELMVTSMPCIHHSRIHSNLSYYKHFHQYYYRRSTIYLSHDVVYRLRALISLYRDRSYQERGLRGIKDSVLDFFYGVTG